MSFYTTLKFRHRRDELPKYENLEYIIDRGDDYSTITVQDKTNRRRYWIERVPTLHWIPNEKNI